MQPDAAALLWDARRATQLILDLIAGRSWQQTVGRIPEGVTSRVEAMGAGNRSAGYQR